MFSEQTDSTLDPPARFELATIAGGRRLSLLLNDRTVTLDDGRIGWTSNGAPREARLADLCEIHLQTDSMRRGVVPACRLTFLNGETLRILAATRTGAPDADERRIYAEFIAALHLRLAPEDRQRMRFTCGYAGNRATMLRVLACAGGLLAVILVVAAMVAPKGGFKGVLLAVGVGIGSWRLFHTAEANAPRNYDPQNLPLEMIPRSW